MDLMEKQQDIGTQNLLLKEDWKGEKKQLSQQQQKETNENEKRGSAHPFTNEERSKPLSKNVLQNRCKTDQQVHQMRILLQ